MKVSREDRSESERAERVARAIQERARRLEILDRQALRRRLRDMGVRRRLGQAERPDHGWEALTPSEIAAVEAITSGMTNRGPPPICFSRLTR